MYLPIKLKTFDRLLTGKVISKHTKQLQREKMPKMLKTLQCYRLGYLNIIKPLKRKWAT